jgi:uridine phosphorylase
MRMEERAWYLGATSSQVADRALLVGDRGRIDRIARRLDDAEHLNDERGLWTVTGTYKGMPVTAAAFGMGAPIAAVVLHELSTIGVTTFLRLGTVMTLADGPLGDFLLADAALRGESTSGTYVPEGYPAVADHDLGESIRRRLEEARVPWRAGVFATYDGFYTEMLALREADRDRVAERVAGLRRLGVLGIDMESSAILAIGRALGARAASLCVATVAWEGARKMTAEERAPAEDRLVEIGLDALYDLGRDVGGVPR